MSTAATNLTATSRVEPTQHLGQLIGGYQIAACLYAAAFLNIADLLASGPRRVEDLAVETKTNVDRLYRTLRA